MAGESAAAGAVRADLDPISLANFANGWRGAGLRGAGNREESMPAALRQSLDLFVVNVTGFSLPGFP